MKLIYCSDCSDVVKCRLTKTFCECGRSWGQYHDDNNATFGGLAIPLGFNNFSLVQALSIREDATAKNGIEFRAFVISETDCETFKLESKRDT